MSFFYKANLNTFDNLNILMIKSFLGKVPLIIYTEAGEKYCDTKHIFFYLNIIKEFLARRLMADQK